MFSAITLFIFGFVLLLKGADTLTDAASSFAKKLGINEFLVGVVVVGIGTSIPELVVTVFSNMQGVPNVGVGTVIGSNTFNILGILGIAALIRPLSLTRGQLWRHLPLNAVAVAFVGILVAVGLGGIGLSRLDGVLLLLAFIAWLGYLCFVNKYVSAGEIAGGTVTIDRPNFMNLALLVAGIIGVTIGGDWVTQSAIALAGALGLSQSVIGLTVIGVGTSLPELFASAVAAYKRNYGIAIGNVIGSNIFDFLMILGVAAFMKPIAFTPALLIDLWITATVAALLFGCMLLSRRHTLGRAHGLIFVALYAAYSYYLFYIR